MRILDFDGEVPKLKPQALAQKNAQLAVNVDLYGGYLRPHRAPHFMQSVVDERGQPFARAEDVKMFIPVGTHMVGFPEEHHWVRDPRNSAGAGTVLFVRDGKLWRLSPRMVSAGTGATPVGIEKPAAPPALTKVPGVGCLSVWDAHACSERNLHCDPDADAPEVRAYRIAYVNECGEEGEPSDPSDLIDIRNGDGVAVSDINTPPPNAVARRIYRSATTTDGNVVWLFVAEDVISDTVFIDDVCPQALGEKLYYETFPMPECIEGVALARNLQTVVWSANEFWVSAPKSPHIYEPRTRITLPYRIQFIAHYTPAVEGETHYDLAIGTVGFPYAADVRDDAQTRISEIQRWYPAISKFGYTSALGAVFYVSDKGIIVFDDKKADLLTDEVMTEREWAEFRPETVRLTAYDQRVFAWYTQADMTRSGLLFVTPLYDKRRSFSLSRVTLAVDMAYAEVGRDMLMLIGTDVYAWGRGTELMRYEWWSKVEVSAARWTPAVFKVVGDDVLPYTRGVRDAQTRFDLWKKRHCDLDPMEYFVGHPTDRKFLRQLTGDGADVRVTLYCEGDEVYSRPVRWAEPVLLRCRRRGIEWSIKVTGTTTLRELHLQKSHDDLQNDGGHA